MLIFIVVYLLLNYFLPFFFAEVKWGSLVLNEWYLKWAFMVNLIGTRPISGVKVQMCS